jgi:hypothetical protein
VHQTDVHFHDDDDHHHTCLPRAQRKYFIYGPALNLVTNGLLYPTKLIKVRMQSEVGPGGYRSVAHAFRDIIKTEGPRSL